MPFDKKGFTKTVRKKSDGAAGKKAMKGKAKKKGGQKEALAHDLLSSEENQKFSGNMVSPFNSAAGSDMSPIDGVDSEFSVGGRGSGSSAAGGGPSSSAAGGGVSAGATASTTAFGAATSVGSGFGTSAGAAAFGAPANVGSGFGTSRTPAAPFGAWRFRRRGTIDSRNGDIPPGAFASMDGSELAGGAFAGLDKAKLKDTFDGMNKEELQNTFGMTASQMEDAVAGMLFDEPQEDIQSAFWGEGDANLNGEGGAKGADAAKPKGSAKAGGGRGGGLAREMKGLLPPEENENNDIAEEELDAIMQDDGKTNPLWKGVTRAAIRRMARRGGVKRFSAEAYNEARRNLQQFLDKVLSDAALYCEHGKRHTIRPKDLVMALKRAGRDICGYGFQHG
eukprot:gene132-219_t